MYIWNFSRHEIIGENGFEDVYSRIMTVFFEGGVGSRVLIRGLA